jgi:hypothetical protein
MVVNAVDTRATRWHEDRLFYSGFAISAIVLVLAAFGRTYYLKAYTGAPPLPWLVHLHGAIFTAWMGLFAIQTWLVRSRRTDLHRHLGVMGGLFAVVLVVMGYTIAIVGARTGWTGPGNPRDATEALSFLAIPLGDLVLFVGFFAAALWFRRQPETHKRLMLLAMIGGVLPASFGRVPLGSVVGVAFYLAGPLYDRVVRRRVHRVYTWGVASIVISLPLRLWLGQSEPWHQFARWITR